MEYEDLAIVIPSYNENQVLEQTLFALSDFPLVVLVDDASRDGTRETVSKFSNVIYLRHPTNRGQGAALETGFEFLRRASEVKFIATFDADGQHPVDDLKSMYRRISESNYSVVLGSRFHTPLKKDINLKVGLLRLYALILRLSTRIQVTDVHNGLRVFRMDLVRNFNIYTDGYGHADEILRAIQSGGYTFTEHYTNITYTEYSKSKGQPLINGINIIFDKIWRHN